MAIQQASIHTAGQAEKKDFGPLSGADKGTFASHRLARLSMLLLALCSVAYFVSTIWISIKNPLWMDEVLASWMSELPFSRIVDAILHGTFSSPPTYLYFLHGVRLVLGGSNLALRLPSILAVYVSGVVVFLLMRQRFSVPVAALAMVLTLETGLFGFATQVREYALVTMCFSLAVLLWSAPSKRLSTARIAGITLLLAGCIALHFYGVLLVPVFAAMELLWSIVNRRIRAGMWAGIVAAGSSIFVWRPMMRNIMKFTGTYAASPGYFAKPTLSRLLTAYEDLAFGGKSAILLCGFLGCMAIYFLLERFVTNSSAASLAFERSDTPKDAINLDIIILSTIAFPLIVFLFAVVVTQTFNERYAVAGAIGFAMLGARLISTSRISALLSCMLLGCSAFLLAMSPRSVPPTDHYGIQALANTPDAAPIVVGEGLAYLELEAAAPQLRNRLVYLTVPPNTTNADPTNEDLVRRWGAYRADMNIQDPERFLSRNPHFYVLHTNESIDLITPWLMRTGMLRAKWNRSNNSTSDIDKGDGNEWLFEASPADTHASSRDAIQAMQTR